MEGSIGTQNGTISDNQDNSKQGRKKSSPLPLPPSVKHLTLTETLLSSNTALSLKLWLISLTFGSLYFICMGIIKPTSKGNAWWMPVELWYWHMSFPSCSAGKDYACNSEDVSSIPGSGRCPVEGNGNPLQYSCLGDPMDRCVMRVTVRGVTRVRHDWLTKQ